MIASHNAATKSLEAAICRMNVISDLTHKQIFLAPMAGITDKPFRKICRSMGADACVSEMTSSNPTLYHSKKSRWRMDIIDDESPRIVQIAGADPVMMAEAAKFNVTQGAEVIDINMGCPAKKVCNLMAGSSLLRDEQLVGKILEAVVNAVSVPVTLKIRTGWDLQSKNAITIAKIAVESGIQRLTVHGRTRACKFNGTAEHDTVAEIKSRVLIPVIANGDIDSAEEAARVIRYTGVDGVMIGRCALGDPWIFSRIKTYLQSGTAMPLPDHSGMGRVLIEHLQQIYLFYGDYTGVRIARKHIAWYCAKVPGYSTFQPLINATESCEQQLQLVTEFFWMEGTSHGKLAA